MSERALANPNAAQNRFVGLAWACAVLTGLVLIAWIIDAIVTTHLAGRSAWGVSALAAGICWFGALLSLVLLHVLRMRGSALAGALVGMLIRMTIPLAIGAALVSQGGSLAQAGLFGQLVVFYLVTLAIETVISVVLMKAAPSAVARQSAAANGSASHG